VDGYFCAGDAPDANGPAMVDYLNLRLKHLDATEQGGCSYIAHVGKAAQAIAAGKCSVALITLAGKPRSNKQATGTAYRWTGPERPHTVWEGLYAPTIAAFYGMLTRRFMHERGATLEQMAWVKHSASLHAQHNPHALLQKVFSIDEIMASPMVAEPMRRMDCCVITDGGGALVVTKPEIAKSLKRPLVGVKGYGDTIQIQGGNWNTFVESGAKYSGRDAFAMAGVKPADIQYASIYDNFTVNVLMQLEDLGLCEYGKAGEFAAEGNLIAGQGKLPWNTDGGGLCSNHPQNRGGITKVIEAVRQLRGEANAPVQVKNCELAIASGPGLVMGFGHAHSTVILERL
jgi:acetyl-CoA C-acetyltransferase